MSSSDVTTEIVEFSVRDMGANLATYKACSIGELRMRLAIQTRVLSSCILLFKRSDYRMIEDAHEIDEVFGEGMPPYEVNLVNNLEGAKKGVSGWTAAEWIHALKLHVQFGDENVVQHAEPLMSADQGFREKMREWLVDMITWRRGCSGDENMDERGENIMAAIASGIDVHVTDGAGRTILHTSLISEEVIHALIDGRADVNARSHNGETPLLRTMELQSTAPMRALLNVGADPSLGDYGEEAPLHFAGSCGHYEFAALLIEAEADVNGRDSRGWTPLHHASCRTKKRFISGRPEVIRMLIQAGANVDARDNKGYTPIDMATEEEIEEALQGQ